MVGLNHTKYSSITFHQDIDMKWGIRESRLKRIGFQFKVTVVQRNPYLSAECIVPVQYNISKANLVRGVQLKPSHQMPVDSGKSRWVAHKILKMSTIISYKKTDIMRFTSGWTPEIHLDFIYLKLWTTIESRCHLTLRILQEPVRKILANGTFCIKSQIWL